MPSRIYMALHLVACTPMPADGARNAFLREPQEEAIFSPPVSPIPGEAGGENAPRLGLAEAGFVQPVFDPDTSDHDEAEEASTMADDEQQFLSFLAGLATAEPSAEQERESDAGTCLHVDAAEHGAESGEDGEGEEEDENENEEDEEDEEVEEVEEDEEQQDQQQDQQQQQQLVPKPKAKPLKAAASSPRVPEATRRSGRAPKPKRPQEAPGSDESEKHSKKKKKVAAVKPDPDAAAAATQRRNPRIRLASSSIDRAYATAAAAKRRH